jgi:hypothetical protein
MNEQLFLQILNQKSRELNISPLLLLSGIEGLYTFKDVPINAINYEFLDSLILTIFTLRIGDEFHSIAEYNLSSEHHTVRIAANTELSELSADDIAHSNNPYLQSFASVLDGKSAIRRYHVKALEVAALEVEKVQQLFKSNSIGTIIMAICQTELKEGLDLNAVFGGGGGM